jgi:hypothetical protein
MIKRKLGFLVCSEIIVSTRPDIKVYGRFEHKARVLRFQRTSIRTNIFT